jgi:hypothetical protein
MRLWNGRELRWGTQGWLAALGGALEHTSLLSMFSPLSAHVFEAGSCSVAQVGLKLKILLPQALNAGIAGVHSCLMLRNEDSEAQRGPQLGGSPVQVAFSLPMFLASSAVT